MSRSRRSKIRYPRDLDNPIIPKPPGLINFSDDNPDYDGSKFAEREWFRRFKLLADHYQVPHSRLDMLAVRLAIDHVPGLQFASEKRGRKRKWTIDRLITLAATIEEVRIKNGLNYRAACAFITHNSKYAREWGRPSDHRGSNATWLETLESRLQEGKRLTRRLGHLGKLEKKGPTPR